MTTEAIKKLVLPEKWEEMIAGMQEKAQETLAFAVKREEFLEKLIEENETSKGNILQQNLQVLTEKIQALENRLQTTLATVTDADLALAGSVKLVEDYRKNLESFRKRLATRAGCAIG